MAEGPEPVRLLDVNLLIALAWPRHVHHAVAHAWFERLAGAGWATCPLTQLAFVRISSNPKIIVDAVSPRAAVAALAQIVAVPGHVFWPDDLPVVRLETFATPTLTGHRQVTDAYLVELARHRKGRLATLDQGVADLVPSRSLRTRLVEVVRGRP